MLDQYTLFDEAPPAPRRGEYPLPDHGDVRTCASCGQAIVWHTTDAGKRMPLSLATVVERGGVKYALSHFADCPDAREWSKKPRSS